jgi:hypothetical protein
MLDWLIIAGIVILVAVLVLAYFDMADVVVDLVTALLELAVAAVTLTFALLAVLLNALKRLMDRQRNGNIP